MRWLLPLVWLPAMQGCASLKPVPLAPIFAQAADVAKQLQEANDKHDADVKASLKALVLASCPAEPVERRRCALAIAGQVMETAMWRDTLLNALTAHYNDAKRALATAQACRAQGDEVCVEAQRKDAAEHLARIEAELRVKP